MSTFANAAETLKPMTFINGRSRYGWLPVTFCDAQGNQQTRKFHLHDPLWQFIEELVSQGYVTDSEHTNSYLRKRAANTNS